jgi:hypothetical protein
VFSPVAPAPYRLSWQRACKAFPAVRGNVPLELFMDGVPAISSSLPAVAADLQSAKVLAVGSVSAAVSARVDNEPAVVLYTMGRFAVNCLEVAAYIRHARAERASNPDVALCTSVFDTVLGVTTQLPKPCKASHRKHLGTASSVLRALANAAEAAAGGGADGTGAGAAFLVMRRVAMIDGADVRRQIWAGLALCGAAHELRLHHGDVTIGNFGTLESGDGFPRALDFELCTWQERPAGALARALGPESVVRHRMVLDTAVWFDSKTGRVEVCTAGGAPINVAALMGATFIPGWDLAYFAAGMAVLHGANHPRVASLLEAVFGDVSSAALAESTAPVIKCSPRTLTPVRVLHCLFKYQTPGARDAVRHFVHPDAMARALAAATWTSE